MEVKPVEIYSSDSNYGIVRMPGRSYPGCVIQGDSLAILWRAARTLVEGVGRGQSDQEEFLAELEDLHNSLLDRILHYQNILEQEGFDLPYPQAARLEDMVSLVPDAEPNTES